MDVSTRLRITNLPKDILVEIVSKLHPLQISLLTKSKLFSSLLWDSPLLYSHLLLSADLKMRYLKHLKPNILNIDLPLDSRLPIVDFFNHPHMGIRFAAYRSGTLFLKSLNSSSFKEIKNSDSRLAENEYFIFYTSSDECHKHKLTIINKLKLENLIVDLTKYITPPFDLLSDKHIQYFESICSIKKCIPFEKNKFLIVTEGGYVITFELEINLEEQQIKINKRSLDRVRICEPDLPLIEYLKLYKINQWTKLNINLFTQVDNCILSGKKLLIEERNFKPIVFNFVTEKLSQVEMLPELKKDCYDQRESNSNSIFRCYHRTHPYDFCLISTHINEQNVEVEKWHKHLPRGSCLSSVNEKWLLITREEYVNVSCRVLDSETGNTVCCFHLPQGTARQNIFLLKDHIIIIDQLNNMQLTVIPIANDRPQFTIRFSEFLPGKSVVIQNVHRLGTNLLISTKVNSRLTFFVYDLLKSNQDWLEIEMDEDKENVKKLKTKWKV